jgi:hypothetical protein
MIPSRAKYTMFMWKRVRFSSAKRSTTADAPCTPWHAVSIVSSVTCCPAALALMGTRFLSKDALPLPLKTCSMGAQCRCSYRHHDDRRSISRRTPDPWSPGLGGYRGEERRKGGRRASDRK